jgi:hypothetical protein
VEKFAAWTAPGDCPHSTVHTTRLIWYNEATAQVVCANVPYFLDSLRIWKHFTNICCRNEEFNLTVQYEPTVCTIHSQFISIINLYMFRAGLLLIIRRDCSVYSAIGIVMRLCWLAVGRIEMELPTASQHKRMTYTNRCIYTAVPPDDEQ